MPKRALHRWQIGRAWIDPDGECIALTEDIFDSLPHFWQGHPARDLVKCRFGSHLYGTATETSDEDVRGVFVPDGRSILTGSAKSTNRNAIQSGPTGKIVPGTLDYEAWSIAFFLKLLCEGNTPALDMIFAPEWSWIGEADAAWHELRREAPHRLVTANASAFVGYCRAQANKYGIKGSRVATARAALAKLDSWIDHEEAGRVQRLERYETEVQDFVVVYPDHSNIIAIEQHAGDLLPHWDVCNRKLSFRASLGSARDVMANLVREYGQRAIAAEREEGIDWKALYHAVRVGSEAVELLTTGVITFPCPNAEYLLSVKRGRESYKTVAAIIEGLLEQVERLSLTTKLRRSPDLKWAEEFLIERHLEQCA